MKIALLLTNVAILGETAGCGAAAPGANATLGGGQTSGQGSGSTANSDSTGAGSGQSVNVSLSINGTPHLIQSSYNDMVVDLNAWNSGPGARVDQWPINYGANQMWSFTQTSEPNVLAMQVGANQATCMTVDANNFITVSPCAGIPAQQWQVATTSGAGFNLVNDANKNCLTAGPLDANGASLWVEPCSNAAQQVWVYQQTTAPDSGSFTQFTLSDASGNYTSLSAEIVVPAKPGDDQNTVAVLLGVAPTVEGAGYAAFRALELDWGTMCNEPANFQSWQVFGSVSVENPNTASFTCSAGQIMLVNPGDTLQVVATLNGQTWSTAITDRQTGNSVSFSYEAASVAFNRWYFLPTSPANVSLPQVTMENVAFSSPNLLISDCRPEITRGGDVVTTPSFRGTTCLVQQMTVGPYPASP